MAKSRSLQQAVRYALAMASAVAGVTANAQVAPAPAASTAPVEEVVVTGSRLQTPNETSISPVTTVTAADIQATGLTRAEDILNNLPMVFASMNSTTSNGADGTATINLRGLGPQRTLVLVDGRRLGPGTGDGRNYSDINQIPAALIERIDVETGGASATYGADAVAGVVNFILNTHFEGVKIDVGAHMNQHSNTDSGAQALNNDAGYPLPNKNIGTAYGQSVSIIAGSNFNDGKGNATVYATYDNQGAALQSKFDYSSCALSKASASSLTCGGSQISKSGLILAYANSGANLLYHTIDQHTGNIRPFNSATDLYNYAPLNYYQTPNERWTAGGFLNYDINSHVTAYMEVMMTRNTSQAQVAPSGDFGAGGTTFVPCANPLLSAQQASVVCSPANLAAQGNPTEIIGGNTYSGLNLYFLRRNVEGGNRVAAFQNDAFRIVAGLKGDFGDAWHYDVYGQRGTVDANTSNEGYFNSASVANALNVITGPATLPNGAANPNAGKAECAATYTGADSRCVPYNVWSPGGVTPAALAYLTSPLLIQSTTTEEVVSGSITGDLGHYGLKLPTADNGIQLNVGTEYRQESSNFLPDALSQEGNAEGAGGATPPINGNFHVKEVFTELGVPLIEHMPLVESLSFDGGYRYSDYSEGFKTNTFKLGLEYKPIRDVMARASYQRAIRAPNIGELYTPQVVGLDGSSDPCAGATPQASAAACALTGVTPAQYGHISKSTANQYNGLLGGNPSLVPETADTYSIGLVLTPSMVQNLQFSVDYFNIQVKNVIGPIGGDTVMNNCLTSGDATSSYCQAIHRAPGTGSLWLGNLGYVSDLNVNLGELYTAGFDFKASYRVPLHQLGNLNFQFEGTKLNSLQTTPLAGGPSYDCRGLFGSTCGGANPDWRHVLSATWATPWDGLDVTARWRYIGEDKTELSSTNPALSGTPFLPTANIPAYNYLDLSASFNIYKNIRGQLGVNNIADKSPPIVVGADCSTSSPGGANCNGNTFPGVYDAMGRYLFATVSAQF